MVVPTATVMQNLLQDRQHHFRAGDSGALPLLGNNPETGKQHPLGGISSWLTSRGVDNREAQFRIAFGMVSGLVSEKAVHGENLFQTFAVIETIEVARDIGLSVRR